MRGQEGKWLLKKAMEPRLPREVLYRPKMGFAVPLAQWFRGPLRASACSEALSGERLLNRHGSTQQYLRSLFDAHSPAPATTARRCGRLLMFDAFLRNVVDRGGEATAGGQGRLIAAMRILHVLDHSLPLHSGYAFRTLAILREQRRARLGDAPADHAASCPRVAGRRGNVMAGISTARRWRPNALSTLPGVVYAQEMAATARRIRELAVDVPSRCAARAFAGAECDAGASGRPQARHAGRLRGARAHGRTPPSITASPRKAACATALRARSRLRACDMPIRSRRSATACATRSSRAAVRRRR